MGTLRSHFDHTGLVVNGVILGDPIDIDGNPETFEWNDSMFPDGEIDAEGNITIDEEEFI